jgi:hypothetical protein
MSSAAKQWFVGYRDKHNTAQIERCNAAKRAVERINQRRNEVNEKYDAIIALLEMRNGDTIDPKEIDQLNNELSELNAQAYRAIANATRACAGL